MEIDLKDEEVANEFDTEFATNLIDAECQKALDGKDYEPAQKKPLADRISTAILIGMQGHHGPQFKFLTHVIYMKDGQADYETSCENLWDPPGDGMAAREYSNGSIRAIVTVWGFVCP
jgi:hypothetical protein